MATTDPLKERLKVLEGLRASCTSTPDKNMHELVVPLTAAIEALTRVTTVKEPKALQAALAQSDQLILQAQGLSLLAYMKNLNQLRNVIAEKVTRARPGSEMKGKLEAVLAAHDQTLLTLSKAYEALRQGDREAFEEAQRELLALETPVEGLATKLR